MSDEWRKFLIQWMLPVAIFGVIITFLFAGFTANIKQNSSDLYADTVVTATKDYANDLADSVNQMMSVTGAVANVISGYGIDAENVSAALSQIVSQSEAYMAFMTDSQGNAVSNTGEVVDMSVLPYFSTAYSNSDRYCYFVDNDGIVGNPAMVVTMSVAGETVENKVLAFYPMTAAIVRKIVSADKVYDSGAYSMIIKKSGGIVLSTNSKGDYSANNDVWEEFGKSNSSASIKRIKTKIQSGASGYFDLNVDGNEYLCVYTPIAQSEYCLLINFTKASIAKSEQKLFSDATRKLSWIIVVIVLFIVAVTALNIIEIFVSSRKTEDLKDKADTDQLTGLLNKVATEREIKEYIADHPDSLAMLFMIDIDNFKKINDTMGHAFGDEVLRELGRHIGINFRVSDIIGRTGGDEFTVFLKNLKEDANTLREAQKLIYFFRHFQVGDYVKYSVTASIGAAVFPDHGSDFETLYKAADAAVYKSKKRGKNQLSFFDDRDRTPEEVAEADAHLIDIERKDETPIES